MTLATRLRVGPLSLSLSPTLRCSSVPCHPVHPLRSIAVLGSDLGALGAHEALTAPGAGLRFSRERRHRYRTSSCAVVVVIAERDSLIACFVPAYYRQREGEAWRTSRGTASVVSPMQDVSILRVLPSHRLLPWFLRPNRTDIDGS